MGRCGLAFAFGAALFGGTLLGRSADGPSGAKAVAASGPEWMAGPLWHDFPLTLEPGTGEEGVGPFYYRDEREDDTIWAVPPLVSSTTAKAGDKNQVFVLPPVFSWRRYGDDSRWQFFQVLNGSKLSTIADPEVKRFNLFPFFLYQEVPDQEKAYWSLFPLYGTVRNRLFRDEIHYAAFPLWLKSRKGTMVTRNFLFPFFHLREGPGLAGWQAWPLVGHEHLDPSTRTNLSDEVEIVPGHDNTFALWPFAFHHRTGLGTTNEGTINAVLPLFYLDRAPARDHTAVLWPFISWTDDRAQGFHRWNAPWPLVGFARGEGMTLDRVLPFFSVGHTPSLEAETYLWPLYRRRRIHSESMDRERRQYGMFLYVDLKERNPETGKSSRRIDSWPLFTWTRDPEGKERLQALSIMEPLRRGTGIERNWSPLWAVWRQEWNRSTGAESQSLLWNLYRRDAVAGVTKGSLLFGLVQYQTSPDGRRWRWLHLGPPLPKLPTPEASAVPAAAPKSGTSAPRAKDVSKHR